LKEGENRFWSRVTTSLQVLYQEYLSHKKRTRLELQQEPCSIRYVCRWCAGAPPWQWSRCAKCRAPLPLAVSRCCFPPQPIKLMRFPVPSSQFPHPTSHIPYSRSHFHISLSKSCVLVSRSWVAYGPSNTGSQIHISRVTKSFQHELSLS
jgi:hypothetical protein